ncbi:galactosylgalactosylxylosylprotein 3-beta-glucuronosyltransferase P-like isoform X2 [Artemia franciscana]|uniref:galactosylgalactosylxylosylprotein 3-beta-glucuronosyltransferase P-like isoform X2 n=1 Tax=Artemia franciscana TaxID=6661 RepID=UPI0032DBA990
MNWLRVAKARYVTRKSFILFLLFTVCSLSVLIGQSSKIRQLKNLVVNRRGLKAAPTADVDQENTQYYAYIPVPRKTEEFFDDLSPTVYVITPTFRRPEQIPELTRLGQTLRQVKNLHWIVAEDAQVLTPVVRTTVEKMGIPYTLLVAPMPDEYISKPGHKPRGVSNRNAALQWLRSNNITEGVIYFADDDNSYDLELFEEIRKVKKVGMWPVGLVTKFGLSSPVVKNGKIVGFYDGWIGNRKFPVDMASFGVNLSYLSKFPNISMPFSPGYEETGFLRALNITKDDIEPLAENCTKILVWHTQTKKSKPAEKAAGAKHNNTNIPFLLDQIL